MIKNLYLINSANFNFLHVNLQKDLFFLGDNGSGKTTAIRALHYIFSSDVRNLGIPNDKDGFKEYYFCYQNSYIICEFDTFFIFMYKAGTEIVKVFSKQSCDLARIIDGEGDLYPLDTIKSYLKEGSLHKRVKSLREYRDIVYGHDKRFLDFRFTPIQNSDIFLGLFNEIFNIDKSIIDAKSIKKAIQTTLDYEQSVIHFDHEEYLQKIYEFQAEYRFFKEFEKHKETIEKAYALKENLLVLEETLEELRAFVSFRLQHEQRSYEATLQNLDHNKTNLENVKKLVLIKRSSLKKWHDRAQLCISKLSVEVETLLQLKAKFSHQALLEQKDLADKYEQIQTQLSRIQENYIKLQKGFENELESINKEIEALVYGRDKELVREFEGRAFHQEQNLKIKLQEKRESQELQLEQEETKTHYEIGDLQAEIGEFEANAQEQKALLVQEENLYKTQQNKRQEDFEKQLQKIKQKIQETKESASAKKAKIKQLEYDTSDYERALKKEQAEKEESYTKELQDLQSQKTHYSSMIEAKPNSFKEFLHEEVDAWESVLYPIMDPTLLERSLQELKPRLFKQEHLFAIELDTQNLKQILPKEEATQKLEALCVQIETLQKSYEASLEKLHVEYQKHFDAIAEQKEFTHQEIMLLAQEIEAFELQIEESIKADALQKQSLQSEYQKKEQHAKNALKNAQDEIKNNRELIENMYKDLRRKRRESERLIEELGEEYQKELQEHQQELQKQLQAEQEKISQKIILQEEKKHSISKDERIQELEIAQKDLKDQEQQSIKARHFLEEYAREKNKIESLLKKQNELEEARLKDKEFTKRIEEKIERYEAQKENFAQISKTLESQLKILKKGLERFKNYEDAFDLCSPRESERYLDTLLQEFSENMTVYRQKKVQLQSFLNKLNSMKDMQNEIEISFGFDAYDAHFYISQTPHILLKLDEILEFKEKKLEILKQSGHKRFFNFVQNLLPQKISVFSDSEDKFLSQVAKINRNLAKIDFGVIKNIHLDTKIGDKKSIAKLLEELREVVSELSTVLAQSSLFYDKEDLYKALEMLELKFKEIKTQLKGNAISLQDTIDLSLSFNENGKTVSQVLQLKNESSTGGSMLLKIAIAIAILELFIKEEETPFFLIVDEVSRLHSGNQERLRQFANSKGFKIVFVTPEPTYSKPEHIKYYRFRKNSDDEFEAIELNL